jgi:hypothetical protein
MDNDAEPLGEFLLPESSSSDVGCMRFWQSSLLHLVWALNAGAAVAKTKNRVQENEDAYRIAKRYVMRRPKDDEVAIILIDGEELTWPVGFDTLCDFAGFDPDYVHAKLMAVINSVEQSRKNVMK